MCCTVSFSVPQNLQTGSPKFTDFQCKPTASIVQGRKKIAYLEDGGKSVLRKVDEFLSAYQFPHPARQNTSQSPL